MSDVAAADQTNATFRGLRKEVEELVFDGYPGRLVCAGVVSVEGKDYCGATILETTTVDGLANQRLLSKNNEDFVDRSFG